MILPGFPAGNLLIVFGVLNDGLSDGAAIDGGLNPVPVTFGIAIFPTVALGILTAIRQPPSVVPLLGAHRNNTSPPMDGHERIPVQSGE